jgi:hypothetical protein
MLEELADGDAVVRRRQPGVEACLQCSKLVDDFGARAGRHVLPHSLAVVPTEVDDPEPAVVALAPVDRPLASAPTFAHHGAQVRGEL